MQDFQKAFFPSVYEHSVHPNPSPADAVQAAYCKCAHVPPAHLCSPSMSAVYCQGCLDIWVSASMRHAGYRLLLSDGHSYFMLRGTACFGCLCRYDDQLLQLTVSCLYLSAMVGALGSELSRPLGRKVKVLPALAWHTHLY